jgi:uncharacterized membrane protein
LVGLSTRCGAVRSGGEVVAGRADRWAGSRPEPQTAMDASSVPSTRLGPGFLRHRGSWPALGLGLLVLLYAAFFSILTVQRHHAQLTTANDTGIFDQILWNVVHGRDMQRTIEISFPHWGVHTQPILYLVAPFYLLWPGPEILLILQSAVLALSAVPLYLIARRETGRARLSLILVGIYLLSPALQGMNLIDFHPYAFAPFFLLWTFYYLETPHSGRFALFAALAVACKEDVALVVALMGLYAAVFLGRRKLGLVTFAAGLAWYALAVGVVQPWVSGGFDKQGWRYQALAWPLPELLRTILTRPDVWVPYALQPAKRIYLLGLLWPFGLLPLLAPHVLAIATPALLINLLSSFSAQHEPDLYQYNAAILPFVALAAVRVVGWFAQGAQSPRGRRWAAVPVVVLIVMGGLSYHFWYGHTPLAAHFRMPDCGPHCDVRSELTARIPPAAAVSAQTTLVPHLSQRERIFEYPQGLDVAEYVLLDVVSPQYAFALTDQFYSSIAGLLAGGDFGLLSAKDGYLLFQRGAQTPEDLPADFFRYALVVDADPAQPLEIAFGPLTLVGATFELGREGWVEAELYWRASDAVPAQLRPAIALGHSGGDLVAWHRQDIPFGWEERGWRPGEVLRLTTGVSVGHGPDAGWGTRWTLYAGAVDDATGAWLEPLEGAAQPVADLLREPIDGTEARLVPLVWLRNYWGVTRVERRR